MAVHRPARRLLALMICASALTGCAASKGSWQKPGLTTDQWAVDHATCQSRARNQAADEYQPYARSTYMGSGGVDNASGYNTLMRRHEARRNTQAIYERCLKRKGYSRSAPKKAAGQQG